ncbi:flagellar FliJ family protein [Pelomonas sp. KK5]|uniref:flagellar FliJ family protein n=1 Tax=Pelomonas sp. KK5 TaxID=1855730 RepID=UPI00097BFB8A|nr:flagellar FliJ family protein [Pelomonas sp. KK5]
MSVLIEKSLDTLIELRGRDLEARQADLAGKQVVCARIEANIERLHALMDGVSTAQAPSLAENTAAYKTSLLELAEGQRRELEQRRQHVEQAREAVLDAARRKQVLEQLLQQSRARAQFARQRQQQKQQDELATQMWSRRPA